MTSSSSYSAILFFKCRLNISQFLQSPIFPIFRKPNTVIPKLTTIQAKQNHSAALNPSNKGWRSLLPFLISFICSEDWMAAVMGKNMALPIDATVWNIAPATPWSFLGSDWVVNRPIQGYTVRHKKQRGTLPEIHKQRSLLTEGWEQPKVCDRRWAKSKHQKIVSPNSGKEVASAKCGAHYNVNDGL